MKEGSRLNKKGHRIVSFPFRLLSALEAQKCHKIREDSLKLILMKHVLLILLKKTVATRFPSTQKEVSNLFASYSVSKFNLLHAIHFLFFSNREKQQNNRSTVFLRAGSLFLGFCLFCFFKTKLENYRPITTRFHFPSTSLGCSLTGPVGTRSFSGLGREGSQGTVVNHLK